MQSARRYDLTRVQPRISLFPELRIEVDKGFVQGDVQDSAFRRRHVPRTPRGAFLKTYGSRKKWSAANSRPVPIRPGVSPPGNRPCRLPSWTAGLRQLECRRAKGKSPHPVQTTD